jgi:hypothetical protein
MSKSSQSIEERVTVKTLIWVAILSVVLTVFWDLFTVFLPPMMYCTQNVSNLIPAFGIELLGGPFIAFLITMLLMRIPLVKHRLSTTTLAYLYVTTLGVSYFANTGHPWHVAVGFAVAKASAPLSEAFARHVPDLVAYPEDIAERLIMGYGGLGAMPWTTLSPRILWHILLFTLFAGISLGVASIFRHEWIDVERLPFPQVTLAHSVLVAVENVEKPGWYGRTAFLIGIILGALSVVPVSGAALFPWFPDILMWRSNTCGHGTHWFAPPEIPWHLGIPKWVPLYVFMLLAPLHMLISILFYTLIMEIALFTSFHVFGCYTYMLQAGFCGRNWCSSSIYQAPPLNFWSITTGAMLGLVVMTVFMQRHHIIETLKVAFGKTSKGQEEPISYRTSWIILAVSFVSMVLLFLATGLTPWVSIVIPLVGIVTWFTMAQLWGRLGFMICPEETLSPAITRLLVWPTTTLLPEQVASIDMAVTPIVVEEYIGHQSICGFGGSMYTFLASYKMASLTGVNPRNLLKIAVTCLITTIVVTEIVQVAVIGSVGASRFMGGFNPIVYPYSFGWSFWCFWGRPTPSPVIQAIPHIAIGFVFMVVMRYLCSRFLWLPDPIGAIIAWDWVNSICGIWLPALVAYIVKSIVLKIGGSKLYDEQVVPFVGGFISGTALEILIAALTSYALFPPV